MTTSRVLFHLAGIAMPTCAAALFLTLPTPTASGEITLPALLHEMVNRDVAASLPVPAYTLKQSSSHDPRKTDPANADGWHSKNDHDNAIRSYDYGILRFTVNGKPAGKDVDFYHPEAMLAEPVDLGTHQAKDGKLLLRAEVTGTNAASRGPRFYCGFDCVEIR